jgi:hypothetical protein
MATLARDRLIERGIRPGVFVRKWRHLLHAALARAIAATLLSVSDGTCSDLATPSLEPEAEQDQ